jgi:hypothetical protein
MCSPRWATECSRTATPSNELEATIALECDGDLLQDTDYVRIHKLRKSVGIFGPPLLDAAFNEQAFRACRAAGRAWRSALRGHRNCSTRYHCGLREWPRDRSGSYPVQEHTPASSICLQLETAFGARPGHRCWQMNCSWDRTDWSRRC